MKRAGPGFVQCPYCLALRRWAAWSEQRHREAFEHFSPSQLAATPRWQPFPAICDGEAPGGPVAAVGSGASRPATASGPGKATAAGGGGRTAASCSHGGCHTGTVLALEDGHLWRPEELSPQGWDEEWSASTSASPLENSSDLSCDAGPSTPAPQPLPPPPPPPTGDSKAALKAPEAWLEEEESPSVCASPDSNEGWLDEHSSPSVCPSAGSDVEATEEACPGSPWTSLSGSWSPRKRSRSTPSQRERSRSRLAGRTVLGNACAETLVRPKEE